MTKLFSALFITATFSWFALNWQTTEQVRVGFANLGPYAQANGKQAVYCLVNNDTKNPISSLVLNWQINDGSIESNALNGFSIDPWTSKLFQMPTQLNVGASGNYLAKMWVSMVDGQQQTDPDTLFNPFVALENTASRKVLFENFSSIGCGTCAGANVLLRQIANKTRDVSFFLAYQVDCYSGNPMCQMASADILERKDYYNVQYTPYSVLGSYFGNNSYYFDIELFDSETSRPSPIAISGTAEIVGSNVVGSIFVEPYTNISTDNLIVRLAITQDVVTFATPPGSNGEKEFYHVLRRFVRVPKDDLAPLAQGEPLQFTFSESFAGLNVDLSKFRLAAFVQDTAKREVIQAHEFELAPNTINSAISSASFDIYPNPVQSSASFGMVFPMPILGSLRISISNMLGQVVWKTETIITGNELLFSSIPIPMGVYIISAEINGNFFSKKLLVQ